MFKIKSKAWIIFVICLLLPIGIFLPCTNAAGSGDYEYMLNNNNEAIITKYNGSATQLIVPDTLNGYSVVEIGSEAFIMSDSLESIYLPNSIYKIGNDAFLYCGNLNIISLPSSLTTISERAFGFCEFLDNVVIPEGVTKIDFEAFTECSRLTSITLPKSLSSIAYNAFDYCSEDLTFTVQKGSFAESWLKENGYEQQ